MSVLDFLKRPPPTSADIRTQITKLESELPALDEAIIATFDLDEGPEFSAAVLNRDVQERRIKVLTGLLPEVEAREQRAKAEAAAHEENERRRVQLRWLEGRQSKDLLRAVELFERNVRAVMAGARDIAKLATEAGIPLSTDEYARWSCEAYLDAALGRTIVEKNRFGWEERRRTAGKLGDRSLQKAAEAELADRIATLKSQPPATAETALSEMEWSELHGTPDTSPLREWEPPTVQVPELRALSQEDDWGVRAIERERLHVEKLATSWRPAAVAEDARPAQKPAHELIGADHHEAAQSETPYQTAASADISGTAEDLPAVGLDSPSYREELARNIGELKRLRVDVDAA